MAANGNALYGRSDVAKMADVSESTVQRLIREGVISPKSTSSGWHVFTLNDIEKIKSRRRVKTAQ